MTETIFCGECGREVPRKSIKHKYCDECAYIRQKRASRAAKERKKNERLAAAKAEAEAEKQKDVLCIFTLADKTANRITAEANAFGMTYGTYCAAVRDGCIEKLLKSRGISDPEAILREVKVK